MNKRLALIVIALSLLTPGAASGQVIRSMAAGPEGSTGVRVLAVTVDGSYDSGVLDANNVWQWSRPTLGWRSASWKKARDLFVPLPDGSQGVLELDDLGRIVGVESLTNPSNKTYSNIPLLNLELIAVTGISVPDKYLDVFALDKGGGAMFAFKSPGSGWSYWMQLGGHDLKQIVAGRNQDGRLELFALGGDGAVYHCWQIPGGSSQRWTGWSKLGGTRLRTISVSPDASGRLNLFSVGGDGRVWQTRQAVINGSWTEWTNLGGSDIDFVVPIQNQDGRIELFSVDYRDSKAQGIWHKWQELSGEWGGWQNLVADTHDFMAITRRASGELFVAYGSSRNVCWVGQTSPNGGWRLGGCVRASPASEPSDPPASGARIQQFTAESEYIPVNSSTTVRWRVSDCGVGCNVQLEGRNGLNFSKVFLLSSQLPAQGSYVLTPTETDTKMLLKASGPGGVDEKSFTVRWQPAQGASGGACTDCRLFYLKMTPPSSLFSCVNVAEFAQSEADAKLMAEREWTGYMASTITYDQFVRGCQ